MVAQFRASAVSTFMGRMWEVGTWSKCQDSTLNGRKCVLRTCPRIRPSGFHLLSSSFFSLLRSTSTANSQLHLPPPAPTFIYNTFTPSPKRSCSMLWGQLPMPMMSPWDEGSFAIPYQIKSGELPLHSFIIHHTFIITIRQWNYVPFVSHFLYRCGGRWTLFW